MMKLSDHIASRERSIDFVVQGMLLPNPDPILRAKGNRISVYKDLRSDAHVGGCVRRRKSAVKALEWGLDRGKAASRVAKNVQAIFADLPLEGIIGDMLEAVLYGYQPMEILWGKVGGLIVPNAVVAKPPEWFGFNADGQLRFKSKGRFMDGEELPERKFLLPRQEATYANPYGFADLSMCFWPMVFKRGGVRFWLAFVEKFGSAFSIGKLPRSASADERAELLDALEALIQDGVATIPDDGSVELVEMAGKSASSDLYKELVMFCRSEISIALTGTNQTVEANSNKASASAGLEVAEDIRDADAEIVAGAFNTLVRWICEINWGGGERPVFSLWDQMAQDELQATRDKSNYEAGARFTNAYWMRAYGYQEGDLQPEGKAPVAAPKDVAPAFADAGVEDTADRLQPALASEADGTVKGWVDLIEAELASCQSLAEFGDRLLGLYGHLPAEDLTAVMASAFEVADLRGRFEVKSGA